MRTPTLLVLLIAAVTSAAPVPLPAAKAEWKAGVAAVDITPEHMMYLAGYASRNKPAEAVGQHLFAKALAIEDAAGARMVFVTLDLIGVPRPLRDEVVKHAGEKHKLPPEALLLNASHTHSGPEFRVNRVIADDVAAQRIEDADAYGKRLTQLVLEAISQALAKLEPANIGYSHARCGVSMNRRLPTEKGYANSPNPDGPVDQDVPVLRVESPDGKQLRAILFGYACHNTSASWYFITGDYAGWAQQYLQEEHPGTIALFMMGCGGDQNPYPRGKVEHTAMHGRSLATSVEAALMPKAVPLHGPLRCAYDEATLDFAPVDKAKLLAESNSKNIYEARHAKRVLADLEAGTLRTTVQFPVQAVRFGDQLTFIGFAGETVVDYALRMKREIQSPHIWVAGYCNDVFGYVPSLRVLKEGGYEGGGAMNFTSFPGPFADTVEDRIIAKAQEVLAKVGITTTTASSHSQ